MEAAIDYIDSNHILHVNERYIKHLYFNTELYKYFIQYKQNTSEEYKRTCLVPIR